MDAEGHGVSTLTEVVDESRAGVIAVIGGHLHARARRGRGFGLVPGAVVPLVVDVSGDDGGLVPRQDALLLEVVLYFLVAFVGVPHFRVLVGRRSCGHVVHAEAVHRVHSDGFPGGVSRLIDERAEGFGQIDRYASGCRHASLVILAVAPVAELVEVGSVEPDVFALVDVLGDDV